MTEASVRAYVHVTPAGATLYLPHGGRWCGGTEPVRVVQGTEPGWYRCVAFHYRNRWSVDRGRKVDPRTESARLERLAEGSTHARTGSPGVEGFQRRADASRASLVALRQRQRHYAEILAAAADAADERPRSAHLGAEPADERPRAASPGSYALERISRIMGSVTDLRCDLGGEHAIVCDMLDDAITALARAQARLQHARKRGGG